jgi:MYXO-CTERM domain-containing protein
MSLKFLTVAAASALLAWASPVAADVGRPQAVLSHESMDALEEKFGMIGLLGLLGLFGLRRRDARR